MAATATEQGGKSIILKMGKNALAAVTFTDTGDLVTLANHGLSNGDVVSFATVVTTTGVTASTSYFVISATTNTFQISTTSGGSAVAMTTDGTGTINEYFLTLGGIRSKSLSINSELVDVTNHDSGEWRKILDSAGVRSVSLSGSGVFKDDNMTHAARAAMMANTLKNFKVYVSSAGTDYFSGSFKIVSMEVSGDYNAESNMSISMESSGEITYVAA